MEENRPLKIDLGSGPIPMRVRPGHDYYKDFITIDAYPYQDQPGAVDIVADASEYIPLPDDSVAEVVCVEVYEHIHYARLDKFISEIYRVMQKGAKARFQSPNFEAVAVAFLDRSKSDAEHLYCFHCICGGQSQPFDVHRNLPCRCDIEKAFSKFSSIRFEPRPLIDYPNPNWNYRYHLSWWVVK